MTATVEMADATNESAIITAMDALGPDANDRVVGVVVGTKLVLIKYPIA
jgi:hypothetical protein